MEFDDRAKFDSLFSKFDALPVARRFLSDGLTPVAALQRLRQASTVCLFESVVGGEKVGRYSFLAANPHRVLLAYQQRVIIRESNGTSRESHENNPWEALRREIQAVRVAPADDLPPFTGGAVGFASYDAVRFVEPLGPSPPDDRRLPDLAFAFFDLMIVFDHVTKQLIIIALAWTKRHRTPQLAWEDCCQRIQQTVDLLFAPSTDILSHELPAHPVPLPAAQSNMTHQEYVAAVRRAIEYIRAGDIFQVVLSQRWEVPLVSPPFELYRTLRVLNPSPFMFYVQMPELTLVGSSPEIMCRVVHGTMTVRPLAGTRRRGVHFAEDLQLESELLADPKERAEHVMLVDLGRNDVGRVCQFGSIQLPDVMVVERYSHVMHLSSTVTGRLRSDCDALDALVASLPAGKVSGAPKIRAMQIIDELEPHRRGP
ncbi:MAG TPA: chorismate-binding protein, partial [Pirellulaceae bacterium]|nr:chorismate-binding protein [Pirellulaceae bacterium]